MTPRVVSYTSIYLDAIAILIIFGLMIISVQMRDRRDRVESKGFSRICLFSVLNAFADIVCYATMFKTDKVSIGLHMLALTALQISVFLMIYAWIIYEDYKLYGSRDRLLSQYKKPFIPVAVFIALLIINMFTGFMFTIDDHSVYQPTIMFWIMVGVQYLYIAYSLVVLLKYYKDFGPLHFFHPITLFVPVVFGALTVLVTGISARSISIATGIMFLYMSYIGQWRYDDVQTGFFNHHYLEHIKSIVNARKAEYNGAVSFALKGDVLAFAEILRNEFPKDCEIIRMKKDRFLLLSKTGRRGALALLAAVIEDAVEEYNQEHPQQLLRVESDIVIKRRVQSGVDFLEAMEN